MKSKSGFLGYCAYGLGECANSLVMNGIFGFAMLFFTEALHLSPRLAGLAMSVSVFWEAFTEPVMGYVTDRTRSRLGRRHPWMILGGLLMSVSFYCIWAVPAAVRISPLHVLWYLVIVNLVLRTGLTMFFIPYVALGFEIGPDQKARMQIQSIRQVLNMAANFAGPAMAWVLFFPEVGGAAAIGKPATSNPENFATMGLMFAIAIAGFAVAAIVSTWRWIEDSRLMPKDETAAARGLIREIKVIVMDRNPRRIFIFVFFAAVSWIMVGSLQMYVYVYFMKFGSSEKSFAHGSTMIGAAIGGVISGWLSRRLGKKTAILAGGLISVACNCVLGGIYLTHALATGTTLGAVVFIGLHGTYWLGTSIMFTVATAMIADLSALQFSRTGINRDGGYSAVLSLVQRLAAGFSLGCSGLILGAIGFDPEIFTEPYSAVVIWRLGAAMLLVGPLFTIVALWVMRGYPVEKNSEVLKPKQQLA